MKLTILAGLLLLTLSFPSITGRWRVHDRRGADFMINFKTDQTFTAYTAGGKVLITGNYKTNEDSLFVNDANCNAAYWGSYQLVFVGQDSAVFKLISDTCSGRAQAVNGISLGRVLSR